MRAEDWGLMTEDWGLLRTAEDDSTNISLPAPPQKRKYRLCTAAQRGRFRVGVNHGLYAILRSFVGKRRTHILPAALMAKDKRHAFKSVFANAARKCTYRTCLEQARVRPGRADQTVRKPLHDRTTRWQPIVQEHREGNESHHSPIYTYVWLKNTIISMLFIYYLFDRFPRGAVIHGRYTGLWTYDVQVEHVDGWTLEDLRKK